MENVNRWHFTEEQLANTPSRKFEINPTRELSYRQQAANFIGDIGRRLRLNHLCINTAVMYMHRFYMFHSFAEIHRNKLAVPALFLAAKVEEQPRKLEHVIKVSHACLHKDNPHLDVKGEVYKEKVDEVVAYESMLLQTLAFDLDIDHPHPHVIKACQNLKVRKEITEAAYEMATYSLHMTTMCLQYRSKIVACICINVACRQANYAIAIHPNGNEWFQDVDGSVTREYLERLTQEFMPSLVANQRWFRRNCDNNSGGHPGSNNRLPIENAGGHQGPNNPLPIENAGGHQGPRNPLPIENVGGHQGPKNLLPVKNAGSNSSPKNLLPVENAGSDPSIKNLLPVKNVGSNSCSEKLLPVERARSNPGPMNLLPVENADRADRESSISTQPTAVPTPCASFQAQISSHPVFEPPTSASNTPQPAVSTRISETNVSTSSMRQLLKTPSSVPKDIKLNGLKEIGPLERRKALSNKSASSTKERSKRTKHTSSPSKDKVLITQTEKTNGIKIKIRKDVIRLNGVESTSKMNEPFVEKTSSSKEHISSTTTEHSNPKHERHKKRKHSFSSSTDKVLSNDSEQTTEIKVKIRKDLICLKGVESSQKSVFFIRQQSTL